MITSCKVLMFVFTLYSFGKYSSLRLLRGRKKSISTNRIYLSNLSSKSSSQKGTQSNENQKAETDIITPRSVDYSQWYNDVISAADMIDLSPVRGCMVIKPWGMGIWDLIRSELDQKIKILGAENAYFPLFIPKSFLAKEAEHVDGFAKECAVVTHHRLCLSEDGKDLIPDPDAKLEEPLIVRPTSETVIWYMFGKWIKSYRDLPLKINQWANVVRWEMRTRPFLRTTEFLWQEGHTAHISAEDAIATARETLDMYANFCQEFLAMPVVKGCKSPSERFAGAEDTFTIEALMQNGWALQSGTSHYLGQNFAKAFDVYFQTESGSRELVYATSWGLSTRLIGALIMTHSDDKGLVLPPKLAPVQVVIIPITKGQGEDHDKVMSRVNDIKLELSNANIRVKVDERTHIRPGAKYFEYERKGIPIRIDVGPRDYANDAAVITLRSKIGEKTIIKTNMQLVDNIKGMLQQINTDLYDTANERLQANTFVVNSYEDMKNMINNDKFGFYLAPWKCSATNEAKIKEDCKATIRCYPDIYNEKPPTGDVKCFYSQEQATHYAIFARAY